MDKALLAAARAQGLLEPLLSYLDRRIEENSKSEKPEGPEWPLKRAYQDGAANEAKDIRKWLNNRSKPTPDGALNSEE